MSRCRARTFLGMIVFLVLTSCASSGPARGAPTDPGCSERSEPLPESLEGVLDEDLFLQRIGPYIEEHAGQRTASGRSEAPRVLFSVRFVDNPDRQWVRPLEGNVASSMMDVLAEELLDLLKFPEEVEDEEESVERDDAVEDTREDIPATFRIELTLGESPVLTLHHSVTCTPLLRNQRAITQAHRRFVRRMEPGGHRVRIQVFVTEEGRPERPRVEDAPADPDQVRALEVIGMQMRFHPARIDGFPVAVWVVVPLTYGSRRN